MGNITKVLHEGRQEGARRFISGDMNIELGLRCRDEDEEMQEMYGPQWWHGIDADPGGLKKAMWRKIMKEFNCKAIATWSSCDDWRERACTHRA